VYYHSRCSARIARNILNQITALPGTVNRGIRTANFRVLRKAEYPAVLVECGYLSNPGEGSRCASGAWHERFAEAIARGIIIQRHGGVDALAAQ
jgi:N-acetylmuramoyl-L-alanine amidase